MPIERLPGSRPRLSVFLASTPRSGSWLLAESLRAVGVAGQPEEYLRLDLEEDYRSAWGLPADAGYDLMLDAMLTAGQTPNGVFGIKVHWFQFALLMQRLAEIERSLPSRPRYGLALVEGHLGPIRWVYLERRDTARQAVSWYRATVTDQWWRFPGERQRPMRVPFDFEAIKTLHHLLLDYRKAWRTWFDAESVDVLEVFYEDLAARPAETLRRVLAHLGLPAPRRVPRPALARQADAATERLLADYRRSYVAMFGDEAWPRRDAEALRFPSSTTTRPVS